MPQGNENIRVAKENGCQLYTQDQQAGEIPISEVSTNKRIQWETTLNYKAEGRNNQEVSKIKVTHPKR